MRSVKLYNTMSNDKEIFKPKEPGKVSMYVCGITTYDFSHIGHARAYVAFDVLYRYLLHLGYEVYYVRNFTDIDDKIIKRATELKEDPLDLSKRFCDEFLADMDALQCLSPTKQPRVTEHIEDIVAMIAKIIENDCAYTVDGDVYFSVDKSPSYGRLSGRKLEDNRAGERVAVDSRKRNPADFALWKAAKPGEPSWESPWGLGRPGWHIECSAMSAHYLSHSFDIHGGGMDLTFPHHENELAQSSAACSETHISYWVHNGFVTVNDEKMSKSLGNFFTIRTVFELYHPLALRYFLMSTHYRSPVNYSLKQLDIVSQSVYRIYQTLRDCEEALLPFRKKNSDDKPKTIKIPADAQKCIMKLQNDFYSAMSNDLLTPPLLNDSLQEAYTFANKSVTKLKKETQQALFEGLSLVEKEIKKVLEVLGLLVLPYSKVLQELNYKGLARAKITEEYLLQQIKLRHELRQVKEYHRADKIRRDLRALGIKLMDDGGGTTWKVSKPKNDFYSAMSNDLLTPPLLNDSLQEAYTFANKSVTKLKKETQPALFEGLSLVEKEIRKVLDVLRLLSVLPYLEVLQELNYKGLARAKITEEYLLQQMKSVSQRLSLEHS